MSATGPEIDLRACPFCGGAARANCDAPLMYLECVSCGARGPQSTSAEAVWLGWQVRWPLPRTWDDGYAHMLDGLEATRRTDVEREKLAHLDTDHPEPGPGAEGGNA